jgi:phosphoribosylformimino-5-aminoimidazole carboxamide ribotide isomerase
VEIIPVIDLMGGIVVHAKAGIRTTYQPIDSMLTEATDLLAVVADILAFFPFKTIYIADLDAISGKKIDMVLYRQCLKKFPETTFWLDAGIRDPLDMVQFETSERLVMVLGSESLQALSLLSDIDQCVLSLDFKQNQFLGNKEILKQVGLWPEEVIVMNLDRVGIELGPDFDLIAEIHSRKRDVQLIAAGGVRGHGDLVSLAEAGTKKVLIASALHQGKITREMLKQY